jgi:hypothetical protein
MERKGRGTEGKEMRFPSVREGVEKGAGWRFRSQRRRKEWGGWFGKKKHLTGGSRLSEGKKVRERNLRGGLVRWAGALLG